MKSYERHVHTHTHTLYTLNVVYVHVDHNVCVHSIRISYMLCTLPSIPCEWNGYNIRIYYTWIYGWLCTRFADGMPLFSSFVGSSFTWSHHQCIRCVMWMWLLHRARTKPINIDIQRIHILWAQQGRPSGTRSTTAATQHRYQVSWRLATDNCLYFVLTIFTLPYANI